MSNHQLTPGRKTSPLQGLTVRQPIVTTHGGVLIVAALLTLLTEFGVPLTAGQQSAITKFIAVAGVLVAGLLAHRKVTPTADPRDTLGRRLAPQPAEPPPTRNAPSGYDLHAATVQGAVPGGNVDSGTGRVAGDRDDDHAGDDGGDDDGDRVEGSLDRLFGPPDPGPGRHHLTAPPTAPPPGPPPLPEPRTDHGPGGPTEPDRG